MQSQYISLIPSEYISYHHSIIRTNAESFVPSDYLSYHDSIYSTITLSFVPTLQHSDFCTISVSFVPREYSAA